MDVHWDCDLGSLFSLSPAHFTWCCCLPDVPESEQVCKCITQHLVRGLILKFDSSILPPTRLYFSNLFPSDSNKYLLIPYFPSA